MSFGKYINPYTSRKRVRSKTLGRRCSPQYALKKFMPIKDLKWKGPEELEKKNLIR